ncbi:hypothetical protein [Sphingobacterium paucimobilis]|uniref:Antitoxin SocA-like Panacea domain-containing protein n=1 Tax=Sphingobacterium paucimobilis HER1398 TaxID=1346330 RepID=U2HHW1_9SPHI|nr:hypothetical protein [Sphingobacterium paucimobilis]ERJ61346.1 hypothetical protein M472_21560 [Sphingobacterium paucimobilis HER1398]
MNKIVLFEYFLKKLVEWYCDYYQLNITNFNDHPYNNLSKLKVIKLHFFACSTNSEALEIFDDFHAMPYGHVESGIYNHLDNLRFCNVTNSKLIINDMNSFLNFFPKNYEVIDACIERLRNINLSLISLEPFELVELSHKWFSWRYNFQKARQNGSYSRPINSELILKEEKFYSIF